MAFIDRIPLERQPDQVDTTITLLLLNGATRTGTLKQLVRSGMVNKVLVELDETGVLHYYPIDSLLEIDPKLTELSE